MGIFGLSGRSSVGTLFGTNENTRVALKKKNPGVEKTELAAQAILEQENRPAFGPLTRSMAFILGDVSANAKMGWATVHGSDPAGSSALSLANSLNVFSGAFGINEGIKEGKLCHELKEPFWRAHAAIRVLRGSLSTAAGVMMIPLRILKILGKQGLAKLGTAASSLFSCVTILNLAANAMSVHKEKLFRKELYAITCNLQLSEREKGEELQRMLQQKLVLTCKEREAIEKKVDAASPDLCVLDKWKKCHELHMIVLAKKEYRLSKLIGQENVARIKEGDVIELLQEVVKESNSKWNLSCILLSLSAASVVVMALGTFALCGALLAVAGGLSALIGLVWLVVDAYYFIEAFSTEKTGKYDFLWLTASSLLFVIGVVAFAVLSGGIAPLIVAGAIGAVSLSIYIATWFQLRRLGKIRAAKAGFLALPKEVQDKIAYFIWEKNKHNVEKIGKYDRGGNFGASFLLNHLRDPSVSAAVQQALGTGSHSELLAAFSDRLRIA